MKKINTLCLTCFICLCFYLSSCNPGERPAGSTSSEEGIVDSIEAQHTYKHQHGDTIRTHSHAQDSDTALHSH